MTYDLLAGRPHPTILNAREAIHLEEEHRRKARIREQEHEDATLRRVYKAIMVAPTLNLCRALLNGERVPLSRLDPTAVRRYGLRANPCTHCGTLPDRITLDDLNDVSEARQAA